MFDSNGYPERPGFIVTKSVATLVADRGTRHPPSPTHPPTHPASFIMCLLTDPSKLAHLLAEMSAFRRPRQTSTRTSCKPWALPPESLSWCIGHPGRLPVCVKRPASRREARGRRYFRGPGCSAGRHECERGLGRCSFFCITLYCSNPPEEIP